MIQLRGNIFSCEWFLWENNINNSILKKKINMYTLYIHLNACKLLTWYVWYSVHGPVLHVEIRKRKFSAKSQNKCAIRRFNIVPFYLLIWSMFCLKIWITCIYFSRNFWYNQIEEWDTLNVSGKLKYDMRFHSVLLIDFTERCVHV